MHLPSNPSLLMRLPVLEMSFVLVAHCEWSCRCYRKSTETLAYSWWSMKDSKQPASELVTLAQQKLRGDKFFNPDDTKHMLAILGQRFGLEICFGHPEAVEHVKSGVANHLRICLATTEDRTWSFTCYPSEPFLSCIAASILHGSTDTLRRCLESLQRKVFNGMISTDQAGELASRILWLLAKDLLVRAEGKNLFFTGSPKKWSAMLNDCRMIPLLGYLEHVFGKHTWPSEALAAFDRAYINFSHWLDMDKNIGTNDPSGVQYDLVVDSIFRDTNEH